MVDRVLFFPDKPELSGIVIDYVFFDNVVGYPILQGATSSNPSHQRQAPEASGPSEGQAPGCSVSPAVDGSARGGATARNEIIQSAKRLHAKSLANEVNNMLVEQTDGYAAADPGHVRPRSRLCGSPP